MYDRKRDCVLVTAVVPNLFKVTYFSQVDATSLHFH